MKWRDSDDSSTTETEKPFEEEYSPLKGKGIGMASHRSLKPGGLFLWIFGTLIVLVILMIWIFSDGKSGVDGNRLSALEADLDRYAERLGQLEQAPQSASRNTDLEKQLALLAKRLDRLEASTAKRLNELDHAYKALAEKNAQSPPKQQTAANTTEAASSQGKIHVVQKQETLYGISRQYGLSVKQLRKLNQMKKGETIYPGQKLVVGQ